MLNFTRETKLGFATVQLLQMALAVSSWSDKYKYLIRTEAALTLFDEGQIILSTRNDSFILVIDGAESQTFRSRNANEGIKLLLERLAQDS